MLKVVNTAEKKLNVTYSGTHNLWEHELITRNLIHEWIRWLSEWTDQQLQELLDGTNNRHENRQNENKLINRHPHRLINDRRLDGIFTLDVPYYRLETTTRAIFCDHGNGNIVFYGLGE